MPSLVRAEIGVGRENDALVFDGAVTIPDVRPWWPHTHGSPHLYDARLIVGGVRFELGRVGFRELRVAGDLERDGIQFEHQRRPGVRSGSRVDTHRADFPARDGGEPSAVTAGGR